MDEYTARELQDHVATIAWLAEQEWSNGNVGMYGTSYSGFNSLQVAALRPPALKAIIPIYATDRRYTDDVHYGGGARRGIDFLDYPAYMVALIALPPVPSVYGEGWREEWHRRIEANDPWELGWLEHQNEDDYWRHGSVFFDYDAIEAATLVIAGHADGYRNMAFRAFERLRAPEEGPLRSVEPHEPAAVDAGTADRPRPGDDRLVEAMARRRRERSTSSPPISIFVRRWTDPAPDVDTYAGEWRAEPAWPPARLVEDRRRLDSAAAAGSRTAAVADGHEDVLDDPRRRRRDGVDLVRRDAPLRSAVGPAAGRGVLARLRLAGRPRRPRSWGVRGWSSPSPRRSRWRSSRRSSATSRPTARSALVTRGILNLTHRDIATSTPKPLPPGEPVTATIELDATAYVFEPGHRIRLDLAGSDFPSSWPPPFAGTIEVDRAGSTLVLPVLEGPPVLPPPEFEPGAPEPSLPERVTWEIREDVLRARAERRDRPRRRARAERARRRIGPLLGRDHGRRSHEPGHSRASAGASLVLSWDEASVRTESRATLRSDPERGISRSSSRSTTATSGSPSGDGSGRRRATCSSARSAGARAPLRRGARAPAPASIPASQRRLPSIPIPGERVRDRLVERARPRAPPPSPSRRRRRGTRGAAGATSGTTSRASSPSPSTKSGSAQTNDVSAPPADRAASTTSAVVAGSAGPTTP